MRDYYGGHMHGMIRLNPNLPWNSCCSNGRSSKIHPDRTTAAAVRCDVTRRWWNTATGERWALGEAKLLPDSSSSLELADEKGDGRAIGARFIAHASSRSALAVSPLWLPSLRFYSVRIDKSWPLKRNGAEVENPQRPNPTTKGLHIGKRGRLYLRELYERLPPIQMDLGRNVAPTRKNGRKKEPANAQSARPSFRPSTILLFW